MKNSNVRLACGATSESDRPGGDQSPPRQPLLRRWPILSHDLDPFRIRFHRHRPGMARQLTYTTAIQGNRQTWEDH